MIVIVDTNIIFSAILNINNNINKILKQNNIEFVSINFLKIEIINHKEKIKKIANLDEISFYNIYLTIISNIKFIEEIVITNENYINAFELTKDIDNDDSLFVVLTNQLDGFLWTGDKKLYNGLVKKGYNKVINTEDMNSIFNVY